MSFNIGNNDRMPGFSGIRNIGNSNNPLQQAVDPSNNRGADMVLTPDHPSWHQDQQAQRPLSGSSSESKPGSDTQTSARPDKDSRLPQDAVPQGAKFDPIMPEDVRQGLPQHGQNLPRGSGKPASGEPDFDDLLPPEYIR
ncbi:hypothetical protein BGX21_008965 [Mortierella sp. AD011]|nr:hypothetical protein BGX20_008747 [Mortierella sp. AD010]KAF9397336.1 hypothetical protein BGX21_008965 [Mortierella sp. AD011]